MGVVVLVPNVRLVESGEGPDGRVGALDVRIIDHNVAEHLHTDVVVQREGTEVASC